MSEDTPPTDLPETKAEADTAAEPAPTPESASIEAETEPLSNSSANEETAAEESSTEKAETPKPVKSSLPAHSSTANNKRERVHEVLFEADTKGGRIFDIALFAAIIISLVAISLETVEGLGGYRKVFLWIEYLVTFFFTVEYGLRIWCVKRPTRYIFSFFGLIDVLSILPFYVGLIYIIATGSSDTSDITALGALRGLRLLRVFRVLHLGSFVREASQLREAFDHSKTKITVFLTTVLILVVIIGSSVYYAEHQSNPEHFSSIPQSIYWAIVTLTTVGYGDVVPITVLGKGLSVVMMLLGYSLIIVPTGLVSAELVRSQRLSTQHCRQCSREGHDRDARHCKHCGEKL